MTYLTYKELISRLYEELLYKSITKRQAQQKMGKGYEQAIR